MAVSYKMDNDLSGTYELSREDMLRIEEIVQPLLADISFKESPCVDIVPLVRKDGFNVITRKLDINTTGYIHANGDMNDYQRLIVINTEFKNVHYEDDIILKKSRFVTAHEYGHFKLHRQDSEPFFSEHRDTDNKADKKELEADYFARSLLMPVEQFKMYFKIFNELKRGDQMSVVKLLSKIFRVTTEKVKCRIKDMAMLNVG